jgi:hypothetical protein
MAAINFPANPTVGQQFVAAGVTWTYDGNKWTALGNNLGIPDAPSDNQLYGRKNASWSLATGGSGGIGDAPTDGAAYARKSGGWTTLTHLDITDWASAIPAPYVLPTASTTVLGGVKVDGSTIAINSGVISATGASITVADTAPSSPQAGALWFDSAGGQLYVRYNDGDTSQWVPTTNQMGGGYATVAYADAARLGDNRIINGDMRIDQRNNGAGGTASGYTIDRWIYSMTQASKGSWQRAGPNNGALTASGFPYLLSFVSSSAYTPLTNDSFSLYQKVEADTVSDFQWGTANAQPVTLSFWVYATLGGTYGGAIRNDTSTRTYPFSYSVPATTWTKIVVTIPGDTTGTWVLSGNVLGMFVIFDLGSGATFRAPAGAWAAGSYGGANGAVNVVGTNGAGINLTGVKLEIGAVATPYNRQSLTKSLADCQRYYQSFGSGSLMNSGYNSAAAVNYATLLLPVAMRATPTFAVVGVPTYTNCSALSAYYLTPWAVVTQTAVTALGNALAQFGCSLSAEL